MAQRMRIPNAGFKEALWQAICDVRVAIPGIVKSFDADKQTVTVQLSITENFVDPKTLEKTPEKFPVLSDVPIILPRAGGFTITMPIVAGDEVLVMFADFDYGAWWQSGGEDNDQVMRRRHDLSDGFAILAPWSQPRVLTNYSTTALQIRSDDAKKIIEIAAAAINITIADSSDVNVTVQGGKIGLNSNSEIDITAPTIKLNGAVAVSDGATISNGLTATGTVTLDTKVWATHQHTGVSTGGGNTGPPL